VAFLSAVDEDTDTEHKEVKALRAALKEREPAPVGT
jgi:hypothetical protein